METQRPLVRNKLSWKITSFSVDKTDDLKRLFQILQERCHAAGEIEVSNFKQMEQTAEEYEQNKRIIKEGFELKLTVASIDGQELYGGINEIFNSPNFPEQIKSIYVNSEIPLRVPYNYYPSNSIQLLLDFSKPELFNLSILPSQETPNASNITVQGSDATWVHGVFSESSNFIKRHPAKLTWLHKHSIYDLLVWGFGLPFGFWVTYKLSNILNSIFGKLHSIVQSATYVYVFIASLFLFSLLFRYARWVWPLIEYRSSSNIELKHRIILGAITIGLISKFIYDIIKAIF
jgi:uncharacterized membrane protein YuzA (DUF378 family)